MWCTGTGTACRTTQRSQFHTSLNIPLIDFWDPNKRDPDSPLKQISKKGTTRKQGTRFNKMHTDEIKCTKERNDYNQESGERTWGLELALDRVLLCSVEHRAYTMKRDSSWKASDPDETNSTIQVKWTETVPLVCRETSNEITQRWELSKAPNARAKIQKHCNAPPNAQGNTERLTGPITATILSAQPRLWALVIILKVSKFLTLLSSKLLDVVILSSIRLTWNV